jgi:hypothetical protein
MNDKFHVGTFLWGLTLTVSGALLAGVGFGWWDMFVINWAYFAPALLILVGVIILMGALSSGDQRTPSNQP